MGCDRLPLARRQATAYILVMRTLLLVALIAAALSACGDVPIGPVDHSCHVNPMRGVLGSGCDRGGNR